MRLLLPIFFISSFVTILQGDPTVASATKPPVKGGVFFHSAVNGILLECYVSGGLLHKSGGTLVTENGRREPRGKISLLAASELAMKEAKRILGDNLQGEDSTWHLDSASRKGEGGDSAYDYYYHFSFIPFYGTEDSRKGFQTQQLQVVVLLDGTVLLTKKRNSEQDGADQPATAPESKSEGNQKPKPKSEVRSQ